MECPSIISGISMIETDNQNYSENDTSNYTADYEENIRRLKFIAYGVVGSVIIALGILGNAINLAVLTRPTLKGVTFVYLSWLATSDFISLVLGIASMMRLQGIQSLTYAASLYYAYGELPLVNGFMASSVFLVVALTVDRYFSVCLPTRFNEVHNERRAKRSILAAYLLAFFIYVPNCFQKISVKFVRNNQTVYMACENPSVFNHPAFKIYLLVKELMVRLGPVVVLGVLNITIIVTFGKVLKKRQELVSTPSAGIRKYNEEKRLIVLLGGIVILFFVCMTPAAILTLLNSDIKEASFEFQLFRAVANVLELANFAMNFYVYCLCSSDIRRTFVGLFFARKTALKSRYSIAKSSCRRSTKL